MQCNCFLKHKLPCRDKRLVVGVKMRRFLPSTAVVLYFSAPAAIAADRYGEWLLEQLRSSALTLTFKQSVSFDNKVATSELGFVCNQRETSRIVGAVLQNRRSGPAYSLEISLATRTFNSLNNRASCFVAMGKLNFIINVCSQHCSSERLAKVNNPVLRSVLCIT
jgi:hypothetical protein